MEDTGYALNVIVIQFIEEKTKNAIRSGVKIEKGQSKKRLWTGTDANVGVVENRY